MLICHCEAVNDRKIREIAASVGATTPEHLTAHCDAGTRCGGCLPALRQLLDEMCDDHRRSSAAA